MTGQTSGFPDTDAPGQHAETTSSRRFTRRETLIVLVWIVAFAVSFFPVFGDAPVWASGLDWILSIGAPTVAVFLIVLRRLSPEGIRRVGSLSIDQFASVAFSVAAMSWIGAAWGLSGLGALRYEGVTVVAVIESIALLLLVLLTVFAPLLPTLRDDFRGRPEITAHPVARPARVEPRRVATTPAVAAPVLAAPEPDDPATEGAQDDVSSSFGTSTTEQEADGAGTTPLPGAVAAAWPLAGALGGGAAEQARHADTVSLAELGETVVPREASEALAGDSVFAVAEESAVADEPAVTEESEATDESAAAEEPVTEGTPEGIIAESDETVVGDAEAGEPVASQEGESVLADSDEADDEADTVSVRTDPRIALTLDLGPRDSDNGAEQSAPEAATEQTTQDVSAEDDQAGLSSPSGDVASEAQPLDERDGGERASEEGDSSEPSVAGDSPEYVTAPLPETERIADPDNTAFDLDPDLEDAVSEPEELGQGEPEDTVPIEDADAAPVTPIVEEPEAEVTGESGSAPAVLPLSPATDQDDQRPESESAETPEESIVSDAADAEPADSGSSQAVTEDSEAEQAQGPRRGSMFERLVLGLVGEEPEPRAAERTDTGTHDFSDTMVDIFGALLHPPEPEPEPSPTAPDTVTEQRREESAPDESARADAETVSSAPFWALAATERDVLDEAGEPLFRIGPDAWALVLEDRGGAFVVRHDDGRVGYLHDLSDITRG